MNNTEFLKKSIRLKHVVPTRPTQIRLGVMSHSGTGTRELDFVVEVVAKHPFGGYCHGEGDLKHQSVFLYGVMRYEDGHEFRTMQRADFTADCEMGKLLPAVHGKAQIPYRELYWELRRRYGY